MNLRQGRLQSQYTTVDGLSMHAQVSVEPLPKDTTVVILVHVGDMGDMGDMGENKL